MSEEIDNLRQQLLLAGKYGQSLMIENNEVRALRIMTTCSPVHVGKWGCVFSMVIWPAFRMWQLRANDHPYHAPLFTLLSGPLQRFREYSSLILSLMEYGLPPT